MRFGWGEFFRDDELTAHVANACKHVLDLSLNRTEFGGG